MFHFEWYSPFVHLCADKLEFLSDINEFYHAVVSLGNLFGCPVDLVAVVAEPGLLFDLIIDDMALSAFGVSVDRFFRFFHVFLGSLLVSLVIVEIVSIIYERICLLLIFTNLTLVNILTEHVLKAFNSNTFIGFFRILIVLVLFDVRICGVCTISSHSIVASCDGRSSSIISKPRISDSLISASGGGHITIYRLFIRLQIILLLISVDVCFVILCIEHVGSLLIAGKVSSVCFHF